MNTAQHPQVKARGWLLLLSWDREQRAKRVSCPQHKATMELSATSPHICFQGSGAGYKEAALPCGVIHPVQTSKALWSLEGSTDQDLLLHTRSGSCFSWTKCSRGGQSQNDSGSFGPSSPPALCTGVKMGSSFKSGVALFSSLLTSTISLVNSLCKEKKTLRTYIQKSSRHETHKGFGHHSNKMLDQEPKLNT